jgi:hypothetical protein
MYISILQMRSHKFSGIPPLSLVFNLYQMDIPESTQPFLGLLKTYCSKIPQSPWFPHEAELANQDWAASHFIFLLLKHADSPPRPNWAALEKSRDEFLSKEGILIDLQSLLARHWVRVWGGEVHIPQQIQHQFIHLRDYGKDKPKPDFWEKHEHEFRFLERFGEQFSYEINHSTISKKQLLELAEKHRAVFPKTPDSDGLFKLDWFKELPNEKVSISFQTNAHNHDFANEIAILVWKELTNENKEAEGLELLKKWEDKVLRNGFYPSGFLSNLPKQDEEKFVEAVFQQIESEEDLLHPESEILIARLDFYMRDPSIFHPDRMPNFPLKQMGGYDSFEEVRHWDLILGDLFHMQPAWYNLNTYLREILSLEKASHLKTWESGYLKLAERLLDLGQTRPALLYSFCKLVETDFPEIIPVFFKSIETLSLGCFLVQFAPIRPEVLPENNRRHFLPEQEFRSILFQSAFEIALDKLSFQHDAKFAGKSVCESLLMLAGWMFHEKEVGEKDEKQKGTVAGEFHRRYQNAWATLDTNRGRTDYWFLSEPSSILEFAIGFVERLENHVPLPKRNNVKYLDLPYLSLLSSLCRMVQSKRKAFPSDVSLEALEQRIRNAFIKKYCEEYKIAKMDVLNIRLNYSLKGDASWTFEPDNPDFLGFEPLFEARRTELGKFMDAVRPQDFQFAEDGEAAPAGMAEEEDSWLLKKDGKDRSEKLKYRTHFRILLQLYRAFADERVKRKIGLAKWKNTENQIRQKLLDWAVFNRDDSGAGLFDIYNTFLSSSFSSSPPLIQDVIQTVNLFPGEADRREYIIQLTNGLTRLDLLLKIHNSTFDLSCKKYVQEVIDRIDVETFTGSQYLWQPIEAALIEATNEDAFLAIAEKLLAFVKKRSNLKKSIFGQQHSKLLFEIQLILAYRKNDRNGMENAAQEYRADTDNQDGDYLQMRLQFFDGIFLMAENKLEEASGIWKELSKSDTSVDVHYRKFYCEAQFAISDENEQSRVMKLSNAFEEWEKYESGNGKNEDLLRFWDGILYCKMAYLNAIEADAEFDYYASQLSQAGLFDVEVLSLIFKNYSRRGMDEQAGRLFMEAKEHFSRFDARSHEKLLSIEQLINWDATLSSLKSAFEFLNNSSVENLLKILPDVFNPFQAIPEFLLYEFQFAAKELLDKITAVKSITGENQYSDLFTVLLRMRLSFLRFEIGDQPREGKAESDAGELDMTIRHGSQKVAAYEAFIYRDKPRTEEHLTKVFDYNPTGQLLFSVVFFKGKDDKFETYFEKYQAILKNTPFPERYRIIGKFEEVEGFPSSNNLFLGSTTHGDSKAVMFHLFVNLSYGDK